MIANPVSCGSEYRAAAAGAVLAWSGLDRALIGFGAPPAIHWLAAGAAMEAYCRGETPDASARTMWALGYGYAGGLLVAIAQSSGVPFSGPLL